MEKTLGDKIKEIFFCTIAFILMLIAYLWLSTFKNHANAISYPCDQFDYVYHQLDHDDPTNQNTIAFLANRYERSAVDVSQASSRRNLGLQARNIMGMPSDQEIKEHVYDKKCASYWEYRETDAYKENKIVPRYSVYKMNNDENTSLKDKIQYQTEELKKLKQDMEASKSL